MAQTENLRVEVPDRHLQYLLDSLGISTDSPEISEPSYSGPEINNSTSQDYGPPSPGYAQRLQSVLTNPPLKADFPASRGRRIFSAITGGLAGAGYGPEAGIKTAETFKDEPYREAYQDWLTKAGALEKGMGLETAATRARFSGLTGLGSYLRAQGALNPELQGQIATAKENAKSPAMVKEYNFYKSLPGNEQASFEDFISTRRSAMERISSQMVTADSAQQRAAKGEVFKDKEGKTINVDDLRPTEGLVLIGGGNSKDQRYERIDQNLKEFSAGNIKTLFASHTGPGTSTIASGLARTPTVHQEIGLDAAGNPAPQNLTTTPTTTGTQITAPQTTPQNTPIQGGGIPVKSPISQIPTSTPQNSGKGGKGAFNPAVFPPGDFKRQTDKAGLISAGMSQIIGSKNFPESGSLRDYAKLADDTGSRERIGTVIRLIKNGMVEGGGGESIGASALGYGAGASLGGLFTWFKNATGITEGIAKSQVTAINEALSKLNDNEKDYINQLFSSYGSIGGLRQALGMPAYKWSFEALANEVPSIGLADVNNSRTYNNKLSKIGVEAMENIKHSGISDQLLPDKPYWEQQTRDLIKSGKSTPEDKKRRYTVEEVK